MKRYIVAGVLTAVFTVSAVGLLGGCSWAESKTYPTAKLPGAKKFDEELLEKFAKRRKQMDENYEPRTHHLRDNGWAKYTNRLFLESSPYLLQHAHNPVNWHPWSEKTFKKAQKTGRPVLLSVGYSTCHWCHVMEKESFEDVEIARYMNKHYIPIKVDREQRPAVDSIYMKAVRAISESGGWPMTVWLTPDKKPFYGGTYFPPRKGDRGAQVGFLGLLKKLHKAYEKNPQKISQNTKRLTNMIQSTADPTESAEAANVPSESILKEAASSYLDRLDETYGGVQGSKKFPTSLPIRFLLRYHRRSNNDEALDAVNLTLKNMASGGIHDHVGGGFHRYATDQQWLVPHFEKMLYTNALLGRAYLQAYQVTDKALYKRTTKDILDYVRRDMRSPKGAFYSATDADSVNPETGEREEGWFFTWTPSEIQEVLDGKNAKLIQNYYNVTESGNFEGRTILHIDESLKSVASDLELSEEQARKRLKEAKEKLYQFRDKRPHPIRDEKIITAWNGMMISAFARAGLILGNDTYRKTAKKAADFVLNKLYEDGRLYRMIKDGNRGHHGYLSDYAYFTAALLDLYEATRKVKYLKVAKKLDDTLHKKFEDQKAGGFFRTTKKQSEDLLAREKPFRGGSKPSANAIAILNLLRLNEFTLKRSYLKRAEKAFSAFSQRIENYPSAASEMLVALDYYHDEPKEVILVRSKNSKKMNEHTKQMLSVYQNTYLPNRAFAMIAEGKEQKKHKKETPLVKSKKALENETTAYVCKKGKCKLPTRKPETFRKQISQVTPIQEDKGEGEPK